MMTDVQDRAYSDLPVQPGELLAEELEARQMSQRELADRIGRPEQAISEIISGRKSITHDTALELEKALGIAATFWVNLEASYRLGKARLRERGELRRQQDWLDFFPLKEMQKRGMIPKASDKLELTKHVLKFFGVASFAVLRQRQESILGYRVTPRSKVSEGALWAWLREGEIRGQAVETHRYSEDRFRAALGKIRSLTTDHSAEASIDRMAAVCADAGVALIVIKEYPKSGASGVARWLSPDKAMIQLSTRRRFCDMFWFSLLHEAGHVLERQRKRTFVNGINDDPAAEAAADRFAADTLIPPEDWRGFIAAGVWNRSAVQGFARQLGIHPEIVVGRLQHERIIPFDHLNDLRRRFVWSDD